MKKTNYLSIMIAMVIIMSSCGSISITQKRYSRGLNIDWFAAKGDNGSETQNKSKERKVQFKAVVAEESGISVESYSKIDGIKEEKNVKTQFEQLSTVQTLKSKKAIQTPFANNSMQTIGKSNLKPKYSTGIVKGIKETVKSNAKNVPVKVATTNKSDQTDSSDVNLIILVILSLIPPLTLLAIYLYFDEINTHFLINLLLLIIGGGIFVTTAGAAYFGLAVIHSLLVVFGVFG